MVVSFLSYQQFEKGSSALTLQAYQTDLCQFEQYLADVFQTETQKAGRNEIRSWMVALHESGISANSITRKLASLRAYFKFLLREGHIAENPTESIQKPKVPKKLPVVVQENRLDMLLEGDAFPPGFEGLRDKVIIELLYGTGIRRAEIIGLKVSDIDLSEGWLKVLGKRNKERIAPLHSGLCRLLGIYLEERKLHFKGIGEPWLLFTSKGEQTYPMFIDRIVKKYLRLTGPLEKASPHVLRHSFATHLLDHGADLYAIKEALGHTSLAATQVYTHTSVEKLKEVYKKSHPRS